MRSVIKPTIVAMLFVVSFMSLLPIYGQETTNNINSHRVLRSIKNFLFFISKINLITISVIDYNILMDDVKKKL